MEVYQHRENLCFNGISEEAEEDMREVMYEFLGNQDVEFQHIHRIGAMYMGFRADRKSVV